MFNFLKCKISKNGNPGETRSAYFAAHELECKCGCGMTVTDDFLEKLDALRADVGMPFYINSGARCEEHNKRIGGSERSAHKLGRAVDIHLTSPEFAIKLHEKIEEHGLRWGKYDTFTHCDDMLGERNNFDKRTKK